MEIFYQTAKSILRDEYWDNRRVHCKPGWGETNLKKELNEGKKKNSKPFFNSWEKNWAKMLSKGLTLPS